MLKIGLNFLLTYMQRGQFLSKTVFLRQEAKKNTINNNNNNKKLDDANYSPWQNTSEEDLTVITVTGS